MHSHAPCISAVHSVSWQLPAYPYQTDNIEKSFWRFLPPPVRFPVFRIWFADNPAFAYSRLFPVQSPFASATFCSRWQNSFPPVHRMPEWKASVRRLNSWNESAVPRNRHQRPVFSVPVPFPAGWPCFVQNGKWTLSELSQFLHAGIDSAAFEILHDFPLFPSMPRLHKHRRTATPNCSGSADCNSWPVPTENGAWHPFRWTLWHRLPSVSTGTAFSVEMQLFVSLVPW